MTGRSDLDAVTGAFSYSGASIAATLLTRGRRLRTLTGHPGRAPGSSIEVRPLDFDLAGLTGSLQGVDTLYNTYWVRFPHGDVTFEKAVENSRVLFDAAAAAGVRRIVHVSITHADEHSPYPYFRGKALVERHLAGSGVPYAVARPAILFGRDGVLINNIAWLLRRFPVVAVGDGGGYRIRPIHVDDLAALCLDLAGRDENTVVDAVGPQSLPFREILERIRSAVGSRAVLIPVPGQVFPVLTGALGLLLRDTLLTTDEYRAMVDGLADSAAPTTGSVLLSKWIERHAQTLGRRYANELERHYRTPEHPSPSGREVARQ
jgi:uncharacterized protein YbjT (DUF2867 family)